MEASTWLARHTVVDINDITAIIDDMASITIRDLEPELKTKLRVRAAHHGRSMEEEARVVLRTVLAGDDVPPTNLAAAIRNRFAPFDGLDLRIPPREPAREPPRLR